MSPRTRIAVRCALASMAAAGLLMAFGCADFTGTVVGISDGDTIRVMHNGRAERVRLWGIDCPESRQPFGTRAKQFTSGMAFGKTVTVRVRDIDRYGRTVGQVILPDGRDLNHELVRAGLAWWYRQYARGAHELERLESEARAAGRGVWPDKSTVPPWQWRRAVVRTQAAR